MKVPFYYAEFAYTRNARTISVDQAAILTSPAKMTLAVVSRKFAWPEVEMLLSSNAVQSGFLSQV